MTDPAYMHESDDKWDREILRKVDGDNHANEASRERWGLSGDASRERFHLDSTASRERFAESGSARAERYGAAASGYHTDTVRDIKDSRFDVAGVGYGVGKDVGSGFAHTNEEMQEGFCGIKGAVGVVGKEAQTAFALAAGQLGGVAKDVALGFKDAQGQAYLTEGRLSVQATNYANLGSVQAERVRAELGAKTDQLGFEMRLQAQTNAAAQLAASERCCCEMKMLAADIAAKAELTARTLAAESAKQAAECCCELKALIAAQESSRIRDELTRLQTQSAIAAAIAGRPV